MAFGKVALFLVFALCSQAYGESTNLVISSGIGNVTVEETINVGDQNIIIGVKDGVGTIGGDITIGENGTVVDGNGKVIGNITIGGGKSIGDGTGIGNEGTITIGNITIEGGLGINLNGSIIVSHLLVTDSNDTIIIGGPGPVIPPPQSTFGILISCLVNLVRTVLSLVINLLATVTDTVSAKDYPAEIGILNALHLVLSMLKKVLDVIDGIVSGSPSQKIEQQVEELLVTILGGVPGTTGDLGSIVDNILTGTTGILGENGAEAIKYVADLVLSVSLPIALGIYLGPELQ